VAAYDCRPFFRDPAGGQRIHLVIPLPAGTRQAKASIKECKARDQAVAATLAAQALEVWRGDPFLHVLVQGPELAVEDLFLHLSLK
jgi:hypothetical protein